MIPWSTSTKRKQLDARKTSALLCAGAFPGFSNVLAVEAAHVLGEPVKDLNFSYFTAGLGGSGAVNLDITNYGFGPPVPRVVDGQLTQTEAYAGSDFGTIEYDGLNAECWAWPFPEAATTGEFLKITGSSRAGMGTAPAIWNTVLRLMVDVVPRAWWSSKRFSEGLARFSEPLVRVTDAFVGESHAMRVDVSSATSAATVAAVQRHDSFRRCVGQSCAEFVLDAPTRRRRASRCFRKNGSSTARRRVALSSGSWRGSPVTVRCTTGAMARRLTLCGETAHVTVSFANLWGHINRSGNCERGNGLYVRRRRRRSRMATPSTALTWRGGTSRTTPPTVMVVLTRAEAGSLPVLTA